MTGMTPLINVVSLIKHCSKIKVHPGKEFDMQNVSFAAHVVMPLTAHTQTTPEHRPTASVAQTTNAFMYVATT